ncbi:hypothetical protein [Variovorax sp. PAMC26660]|uniref:hypothetical protein n=1 Tax=Variovorax sp. PAMC26660 TaxID=2762322 RepID=UPI00164E444B|nr:hypothetical protein [Variovorax sp. PAMC26660]QNK67137.1 hypothetical protein H7F35_28910 [Variovorax sp. PAMC26660]
MKKLPEYKVLLPDWQGSETQFDDIGEALRPMLNGTITRVAPEDKKRPVHQGASTCDSLLAVHPDAIQIGAPFGTGETVGNGKTFAVFSLGCMGMGGWLLFEALFWPNLSLVIFGSIFLRLDFSLFALPSALPT